ncbi:sugar phosphate isomerase/epimerase/putative cell wall-binding protein/glucose/arabinose dehydrogenase [Microbacteriaceae bacterium SG_E_30_P1]|uniref:Sugar phosphate isomerase/epimerase/putative cell wall-binding protein/glucose/arabinose dehydrogenase n=1 Tax=Antiquaquibacter oligotrophicus TaxID=2880260 RepID=A0ABT6KS43_9MICO|nr:cell wall-binding repeat-containing protein [Antiquaquibacter oligotrophicus]MDH6181902.1 sugar phosphate isomerase/epimerase/putative cell wall-binding protein/glucose/arabinose dehydrogenase [Antiquaquibacter oligotrophicus]UDF12425.1 cell wall-binding repeat-containing protein [Antiquaquibacter oligotrophicus]
MNYTHSRSRALRRPWAVAAAAALGLFAGLLTSPAAAHDGVDHDAEPGAESALDWSNYEKVLITRDVGEPIDLAILPDERIIHTARNGDLRLTDPSTGVTDVVATLPVYANSEDGLQTVALDPGFDENSWVYLVYAPLDADGDGVPDTPTGSAPQMLPEGETVEYWDQWLGVNRLSRFEWTGDTIDLASEQVILDIEVQRGQCCHVGADIDFDADGNLYLSTGDNTPASTPGANGFAPNNDAPGMNPGFDARRGAGNTNDLRGKILRIHVEDDGSYTIPDGNLFEPGTELTRPEIFVMGVRNPFRIEVDPQTNSLSWADYGPDASAAVAETADRGPMGLVEWNVVALDDPHNGGWPFVTGDNFAYNDWDFATGTPGGFFDPDNLVNDSAWNTGLTELPPARPSTLYYGDSPGDQPWDELVNFGSGSGQGPMGGPVYHFDESNPSESKLPEYWDGKAFMGEFSQDYVAAFTVDWDAFDVTHIEDFLPNAALSAANQPIHDNPMDLEFGPDGAMYTLEYGDGFFRANPDAGLYRISYAEGNKSPQASFTATPSSSSAAPLEVTFDAGASTDPDGDSLTYEWDFDGDGSFDAEGVTASHTYTELGAYTARLRVADDGGKFGLTSRQISVGNQAPTVIADYPGNGGFFDWGQAIPFSISTEDAEDGAETVCSRVAWTYGLGHDEHAHPEVSGTGCTGSFRTDPNSPEHGPGALLYGAVVVTYTDNGAGGLPPATGETTIRLNPKLQQAEHAIQREGVTVVADDAASGGSAVEGLGDGDFVAFDPVNFSGISGAVVRASGAGTVDLRWGSADAEPFATATIPAGNDWQDVEISFAAPEGSGALYVTSPSDLALDSIEMVGDGVADVQAPEVAHTLAPAVAGGVGGVFNEPVRFSVQASDNGAIQSVQYSRDGGVTWLNLSANQQYGVTFNENGEYSLTYRATDAGGNVSELGSVSFTIDLEAADADLTPPTVSATVDGRTVTITAEDEGSGVDSIEYRLAGDAEWTTYEAPFTVPGEGAVTVTFRATDVEGNVSTTGSVVVGGDGRILLPVDKVSLQMFSLTPWVSQDGLVPVLERLSEIGFENIEPFGSNFTGYTAEQFRALTDDLGLRVPSSHHNVNEATFDATLEFVRTLGQEYVGSGGFASPGIGTYENTLATAETMNRLGERSVAAGIGKFFGHNHAGEFTTQYEHDGQMMSAWEILVAETNPEWVTFQLDVAWAAHAGVDVPALIDQYADRIDLLHVKDAVNLGGSGSPSFRNLGEGDVPLQEILAAGVAADVNYFVMEYDRAADGESFAADGFEYLTGIPAGSGDVVVDRVAGANRYEVSVNISQAAYPETAPVVYVASGENYPDALSAGPAAAFEGGPLLLVKPGELPGTVGAEIERLAPEKIVVVGGPMSVDDDVFYELSGMAEETIRVAGANRFEVSRNVVEYAFGDEVPLAYIATGEKFPDALSAGGAAGAQDAPVILVQGSASDLDDATAALLADLGTTQTRVLGGSASVSPGVFSDIKALTTALRLGGADRYEAARAVNADAFSSADRAFVATGLNFPDALAGSAWAAASASPMYVAPGTCVTAGVLADLEMLGVTHVTLLGGEASLSPDVFSLTPCA